LEAVPDAVASAHYPFGGMGSCSGPNFNDVCRHFLRATARELQFGRPRENRSIGMPKYRAGRRWNRPRATEYAAFPHGGPFAVDRLVAQRLNFGRSTASVRESAP
jgi:hypothetical protein